MLYNKCKKMQVGIGRNLNVYHMQDILSSTDEKQ